MRRSMLVAASVLALFGSQATPSHAEGELPSGAEGGLPERFRLGDGDSLVVSRATGAATIALCVAEHEERERGAPDPLELARRGGTEREERRGPVSLWCATLPRSEIGFAMWLAGHLRSLKRPEGLPSGEGAEQRALSLALEGAAPALSDASPLPSSSASRPRHVISVTGEISGGDISSLAARYLGVVSAPSVMRPSAWSLHQTSERLSVVEGALGTPEIHYGWLSADAGADVTAALRVAFEILAGTDASRLPRLLVPRGLARRVGTWSAAGTGGTLFGVVVETTSRTSVDRVRRFIDGSLKQLRLVGPSVREVKQAVAVLRRRAFEIWEDPEARAKALAECELVTGDAREFGEEVVSLTAVTAERVRSLAHDLVIDARRTTIETYPALWPADDPALARHQLYTVTEGDTLGSVAARFHVDPAHLAKDNDVDPRYRLMPGQPLWIAPVTSGAPLAR